jgi:adenylosuccinate synthase
MLSGKFNVVTDGSWGSCGKGLIASALAAQHKPQILSTTNMANAGHTAVNVDGSKFIAKALPSASILNMWLPNYHPVVMIGPSAAFDLPTMLKEIDFCGVKDTTFIHPRAGVICESHKLQETNNDTGTKHIASTMQGCGAFLSDKVMRKKDLKLARDYPELDATTTGRWNSLIAAIGAKEELSFPLALQFMLRKGWTAVHEGSQGFSLDINHGSHYPQCTSRGTTAIQNMADMGICPSLLGDIYLVIRPYPIRVGNVVENGATVGHSGDCHKDQQETTWAEVAKAANAPVEVMAGELTTVTKRLRRVFTFSDEQLREAVAINGATKIALNFANYIDWSCYGTDNYKSLPPKVLAFIARIERVAQIPVTVVGTGPQINHVCYADVK